MNEHEQISGLIRARNEAPIPIDPQRTALIVVDMQHYFTWPEFHARKEASLCLSI
jgi:isochorismate hydrolase